MLFFRNLSVAAVCSTLLSAINTTAVAQNVEVVGYVAGIKGSATLKRQGDARPLRLGEFIHKGDLVQVQSPSEVRVDSKSEQVIICGPRDTKGSCSKLFDGSGNMTKPIEWYNRALAIISWFSTPSRNLVTRDNPSPRFRYGAGAAQKIAGTKGDLVLSWEEGLPPFTVTVSDLGGKALLQAQTDQRIYRLSRDALTSRVFEITVADIANRRTTLKVDTGSKLPTLPDVTSMAVNEQHATLLHALWLAAQDSGSWSLEAAQQLGTIAADIPAAQAALDAITSGEAIPAN